MIKPDILLSRFRKFDEYMSILKKLQRYDLKEFCKEPEHYGSAERFLQLAIESLNDIGNHIIAEEDFGAVEWYSDIPKRLQEQNLIDKKLEDSWIKMIGFRNVLVHDYVELDRERVYKILQNNIEDMNHIKKVLVRIL